MHSAPEEQLIGEYRLLELLSENSITRTWLAEQVSVSRRVLLDELLPGQSGRQEEFLADVRAKAGVDHPLVGSVYEAVSTPGVCYYAYELLAGTTLEARKKAAAPFKPGRLAHMLRRVAEAYLQYEALGQSTTPLGLANIHLDEHGVIRLDNLAVAGPRSPEQSQRDIMHLSEELQALVADGQPGTTRVLTLLGWMRGEHIETQLTWEQVRDLCTQIEHQLSEPPPAASPPTKSGILSTKKALLAVTTAVVGLGVIAILTISGHLHPPPPPPPPLAPLAEAVLIPGGKYTTPDGAEAVIPAFRISAQEVTIGEYAAFLESLESLAKDHREHTFDHKSQPAEKTSHLPDDWCAMYSLAKSNGTWKGLQMSLNCPVVGVDWWDCAAYAEWRQARLPTQEEWYAAIRKDVPKTATIQAAGWNQVTADTTDRTPCGLIGMAGSVSEWSGSQAADPTNPLGDRKWVIVGGSYFKPGSNALTREWTDNRSLRRQDLGFRVVSDSN